MSDEINHSFPKFDGFSVEVWEWMNDFIQNYAVDVITYTR